MTTGVAERGTGTMPPRVRQRDLPLLHVIPRYLDTGALNPEAIEKARQVHGHTRNQMKEHLQLGSPATVYRWEQGVSRPRGAHASLLTDYIDQALEIEARQAGERS